MKNIKILLLTLFWYVSTIGSGFFLTYFIFRFYSALEQRQAVSLLPQEKTKALPLILEPQSYTPTKQFYRVPPYQKFLFPSSWLNRYDNCIFSARLNAMKQIGMIPRGLTINDFKQKFLPKKIYQDWKLNQWEQTLNDFTLREISKEFENKSKKDYQWVSLDNVKELIYLARNGVHVMVGITIWIGPSSKNKKPQRYLNSPISHALTITGIKKYYPGEDVIEFNVRDPLPFEPLIGMRVFSKIKNDGYNLFNRQGVPLISKKARSGYIIKKKSKLLPVSGIDNNKG
jgi:hypothetical protein